MDKLKITAKPSILLNNGFIKISSTEYIYKFPCYKYKNQCLIQCIITVDFNENDVYIEVIDICNGTTYAPYYNDSYGNNEVIHEIRHKINSEVSKFIKIGILRKS